MLVGVRERILTIRVIEKIQEDPAYAERLGIKALWENSPRTLKENI